MKNLFLFSFLISVLFACTNAPKTTAETSTAVVSETPSTAPQSDSAAVNDLAAFYSGKLPCSDCEGVETLLTLNADQTRSFSMQENYKGKKGDIVETNGTWTVSGDIVTLKRESSSIKYQVTKEGLVSLNADDSKRDAQSAQKYLLKKVMGE